MAPPPPDCCGQTLEKELGTHNEVLGNISQTITSGTQSLEASVTMLRARMPPRSALSHSCLPPAGALP